MKKDQFNEEPQEPGKIAASAEQVKDGGLLGADSYPLSELGLSPDSTEAGVASGSARETNDEGGGISAPETCIEPECTGSENSKDAEPSHQSTEQVGQRDDSNRLSGEPLPEIGASMRENDVFLAEFAEAAPSPLDPEDLTTFAISEGAQVSMTKKALTTVPVRKPTKESFIRTKNLDGGLYALLELKDEGKVYFLSPSVAKVLEANGESTVFKARLVPTIDRRGNLFLWPLKVSDRENNWNVSAHRAAATAEAKWIRVLSNIPNGVYDALVAADQKAEPAWPEEDFGTILQIAFEGRVIRDCDHPVLKELRGEF